MKKASNKSSLRIAIRNKRKSLTAEQHSQAARGLLDQLRSVPAFLASRKIAMYLVNDGEIDPVEVMKWCWENEKKTYVPLIVQHGNNALVFAQVKQDTEFVENRYGIREPVVEPGLIIGAEQLDLVLTPLVAFDSEGNRVGMGGGFYDTTFEFIKNKAPDSLPSPGSVADPVLVGIAHEIQKVDKICAERWDIPMPTVVTDQHVYTPGN